MSLKTVPACDRPGLFQALNRLLENKTSDSYLGLLVMDIQHFTRLNRIFKYSHGDVMLFSLFDRLTQLADKDHVYRCGSDEFAFIVPELESGASIVLKVNRLLDQLRKPFFWQEKEFSLNVNVGCIALPAKTATAINLLNGAEHLLQKAKTENRTFLFATEPQDQDGDFSWLLEQDLLRALHNNELTLYFQPKVDLKSGLPVSCEALLRWTHPERGAISPIVVIDIVARLNREFELTKWVVNSALRELRSWPQRWKENAVAVNVPANLVHHPEFRLMVDDALALWKVNCEQLTLEITENAILEDQEAGINNLAYFKERGIQISIDDFGTGYSSLEYFKSIPATELKIDKSFVIKMDSDKDDYNIAEVTIDLAHRFGLKVVAEGVENQLSLQKLVDLRCDFAQGFHLSRPLPSEDYSEWLKSYRPSDFWEGLEKGEYVTGLDASELNLDDE